MNLIIESAERDMMTREWDVTAQINGKSYNYVVSDYDYNEAMKNHRRGNHPAALCILKGVK